MRTLAANLSIRRGGPLRVAALSVIASLAAALLPAAAGEPTISLVRASKVHCEPALPFFCGNIHVACAWRSTIAAFPFTLHVGADRGSIDAGGRAADIEQLYTDALVERPGNGEYVVLQPRAAQGFLRLLADGSYSIRLYVGDEAVMSAGRCRQDH